METPGAAEGSQSAGSARRLPGAGEGQIVAIRYPNGEAHYARNKETGEILRADSETMVELTADEAETLGLQDWMPYTRPAETPQPVIPSAPEPTLGPRTRRDQGREGLRQIIELLPRLVDEFYESQTEELYREPEYDAKPE